MSCFTEFLQEGVSASAALQNAIASAISTDRKLHFPKGEYHFTAEGCRQKYCYFSNNDEGVKTIAMLLEDLENFTITGDDALLIFHGRISPLCAFNCRNLKISGFQVDFTDSFVSDADLIRRENNTAWFKFYGKHQVKDGRIIFTEDFYDNLSGMLPFTRFDAEKNELKSGDRPVVITVPNRGILYKDGLVGVEDRFENAGTQAFAVKHELRLCPGIVLDNCTDALLKNITLYHAAGMGFLIQNSENCTVDSCTVKPRNRRVSVSDDALHITDCRGKLKIVNCHLDGTLDDSINVHGVFRKLKKRIPGGKMYYLEAGHYQQQGVFNVRPGDHLELRNRETAIPYAKLKLTGVTPVNKAFVILDFDEKELPAEFTEGDPGWILETQADLEVLNTFCKSLNGRGVLASGLKNVRIAGCHFHTFGAGVFVSGDFSFWYESGPVENMVIEDNFFDNCCYFNWGATHEPLAVFPELRQLAENFCYHNSITVRNNRFKGSKQPQISMMSVKKASVYGNSFELDNTYPFIFDERPGYHFTDENSPMISFCHCDNIEEYDNINFD